MGFTVVGGDYGVGTLIKKEGVVALGTIVRARVNSEERIPVMIDSVLYLLLIPSCIAGFFMGGPVGIALGAGATYLLRMFLGFYTKATIEFQDGSELVVLGKEELINWLTIELKNRFPS